MNGNSQAVRLPKEFRFAAREVFIRKDGANGDVVLSVRPPSGSWADFFALRAETGVPADFISERPLNETKPARDLVADLRAKLERDGTAIGIFDTMIAGDALALKEARTRRRGSEDRDLLELRNQHPIQTPAEFVRRL